MSGRRVAHSAPTGPAGDELPTTAGAADLSGLRADLLATRRGASTPAGPIAPAVGVEDPVGAWVEEPPTVWVEDPVTDPDALAASESATLHPDDLVALHRLPDPRPAPATHPPYALDAGADGLPPWQAPEPRRPRTPRGTVRRAMVLAVAVLAFLVGASLSAVITEGQVRDARAEAAAATAQARDARESASQARAALRQVEERAALTAPVPEDPEVSEGRDAAVSDAGTPAAGG